MIKQYIKIARLDHWIKNIFIFPGMVLGLLYTGNSLESYSQYVIAFFATALISSANYTINEWLDKDTDKYHPVKKLRPSVGGSTNILFKYVMIQYFTLAVVGIGLSLLVNNKVAVLNFIMLVTMALYNIKPFRLKDVAFIDVSIESLNNPIRLTIGWFSVAPNMVPPITIVLAIFFVGVYLMTLKRFSEIRMLKKEISTRDIVKYRKSFMVYSEKSLLAICMLSIAASFFFIGLFIAKYRPELIILFPLVVSLFISTFMESFNDNSAAISPEKLYKSKPVILHLMAIAVVFSIFIHVDVDAIKSILTAHYLN